MFVKTTDRLISVQNAKRCRPIFVGKNATLGTNYLFAADPKNDVITFTPVMPDPLPGISSLGFDALVSYLERIFGVAISDKIKEKVLAVLGRQKPTIDERDRLYKAGRSIIDAWKSRSDSVREEISSTSITPFADLRKLKRLWTDFWRQSVTDRKMIRPVTRANHSNDITVPFAVWDELGWSVKKAVSIVERADGSFYIRTADAGEHKYLYRKVPITSDGTVRGVRYLYFTPTQRKALGIGPELYQEGIELKVTYDFVNQNAIIIEHPTEEDLKTIPHGRKGQQYKYFDKVFSLIRHVNGPLVLPAAFVRHYNIQQDDVLQCELNGSKLFVYGPQPKCSICGEEHTRKQLKKVPICPECADVLDDIRTTVAGNATMKAAVAAAKAELADVMKKLDTILPESEID